MKAWKAELLLFFITFIWGGTFVFTKLGLGDCPPSLYILIRFSTALILSLLFFGKHLKTIKKEQILHGLILGSVFASGFVLQTYGLKFTTVSKSAFITGISVVLTPFVYYFVEKKSVSFWQKIGVVTAAIGLWLFTNPKFDHLNFGDVLTVFSTCFWAFYITYMDVFTRGKSKKSETFQLVIMQFVAAVPICIFFYFLYDYGNSKIVFTNTLLVSLAYNGIIASFCLTLIHTTVQRYTSPVKAALIFSAEPIIASVAAIYVFNDLMGARQWFGGIVLLAGVLIAELLSQEKETV